jgi:hypothetical protein
MIASNWDEVDFPATVKKAVRFCAVACAAPCVALSLAGPAEAAGAGAINPAREVCVSDVRVIAVIQGDPKSGDYRDVGIVVQGKDGTKTTFSSADIGNVGNQPEMRTLQAMSLAALSSQMPVNVIAIKGCNKDDSKGWIPQWSGLEINAY